MLLGNTAVSYSRELRCRSSRVFNLGGKPGGQAGAGDGGEGPGVKTTFRVSGFLNYVISDYTGKLTPRNIKRITIRL